MRPSLAADTIFPQGVRVGLTPLVGLAKSKAFPGFESEDGNVKVLVTELPSDAYNEIKKVFTENPQGAAGIKPHNMETPAGTAYYTAETGKEGANTVRRYSMIVSGGTFSGYIAVQIPENATKIYSDDAVQQMFSTVALRKDVPVEEQLGLMPFNLTDLGNFKNVRTLAPGAALILGDGDEAERLRAGALHDHRRDRPNAPASRTIARVLPSRRRPRSRVCARHVSPCRSRSGSTACRL